MFGQITVPGGDNTLNNFIAVAAPTVNDDITEGYSVKSVWIDNGVTPKEIYMCVDNTDGAAIWIKTSFTIDELGTMAVQDANAVNITGGTIAGTSMDPASVVMPIVSVTASVGTTNLDATKSNALYLLTGGAAHTFVLPDAPDVGTRFRVKNLSSGALTIRGTTAEQLMGAALKDGVTVQTAYAVYLDGIAVDNGIKMDFGSDVELTGFSVYNNSNSSYSGSLKVQYSDNNSSWTTATTWANFGANLSAWNSVSWASVGAHRYWRLVINASAGSGYLSEIKVATPTGDIETTALPTPTNEGTGFVINGAGDLLDSLSSMTLNTGDAFEFEYVSSHLWAVRY